MCWPWNSGSERTIIIQRSLKKIVSVGYMCSGYRKPEHALLLWQGSFELISLQFNFNDKVAPTPPHLGELNSANTCHCLQIIIVERSTISLAAKYVHKIISLFELIPLLRPTVINGVLLYD